MLKDPFPTDGVRYYEDKEVVVTGATGLIGSYAVKLLKESGAKVTAVVHERPENDFTRMADRIVSADLAYPTRAEEVVRGAEVVFCGAGITGGVNLPKIDPVSYVGPATAIVINTLHACHEMGVARFGFLSSTTVYAPSEKSLREDDPEVNGEPYPLYRGICYSKRFLEKLCAYYVDTTRIGVGVVRPAGAYGRFDNFDEKSSHVLPGMVNRALGGSGTFEVWGDGLDVRDFIHAQDVARCLLMATADKPDAMPFNVASGTGVTTLGLAHAVLAAAGREGNKIETRPDKPSALRTRLVNVDRAATMLGFRPQISLEDGVLDVVNWRRSL